MRASHTRGAVSVRFDDPGLVSHAGVVAVMRLAEDAGLSDLAGELVRLGGSVGANAGAKISSIVAGMAAGADSISDLDLVRHGGMAGLFSGIRASSTVGTFLRWFSMGHVAQLEKLSARLLARLAELTPLLAGADRLGLLDLDSKISQVYGRGKDGAAFGYTGVLGLNTLAAALTTAAGRPVIVATRLRGGNADTRRAVSSLARRALGTARAAGATGPLLVRGDSGFYVGELITMLAREGVWFSITAPQHSAIRTAIDAITEHAWQQHTYRDPVLDPHTGQLIHTAQIAETSHTAFTNPTVNPGQKTTARLLVRRTRITTRDEQGELFPAWRYHAVFTNLPPTTTRPATTEPDTTEPDTAGFDTATAWRLHDQRSGAIEHVFAELAAGPLAHFPSGLFAANAAWLSLAALTHNLLRATACLAGPAHARTRLTTLRRRLITIAARVTRTARHITLRLPQDWPWATDFTHLFTTIHAPPHPA
ncbi:IS1380 family transposase [Kibdelosporangium philippinense]|uniref:IS1380 family transposase n=1 Tax=Kibdelosporangium philippinense TaxID=211113 RepID=A0ABS8Z4D9_9PSEU|nr:IS1380 family transposase [Kibdelosporangium philippinense]MCE7002783.1 IS1380 family transposase [Kibdelosporangium philippinense]